jgi:hypothetical protein
MAKHFCPNPYFGQSQCQLLLILRIFADLLNFSVNPITQPPHPAYFNNTFNLTQVLDLPVAGQLRPTRSTSGLTDHASAIGRRHLSHSTVPNRPAHLQKQTGWAERWHGAGFGF